MRSILNRHPSLSISAETHYFEDLRSRLRMNAGPGLKEKEARQCADYFRAIKHRPYGYNGQPGESPLSERAICEAAAEIGNGPDAFFEAFCRLDSSEKGASRWGEKTPRHIFCLAEMFHAFPEAQVICMVRDPRAVVASYRDWKTKACFPSENEPNYAAAFNLERQRIKHSYNILLASMMWSGSVRAALEGQKRFGARRVFIQRYEDLVSGPRVALPALASWLSIDVNEAMLNVPVTNSSVATFDPTAGFAVPFIERWRSRLDQREISVIQSTAFGLMRSLGYRLDPVAGVFFPLFLEYLRLPRSILSAVNANRARIGAFGPYFYRRMCFAIKGRISAGFRRHA
jgi:hypothetical protein